MNIVQKIKAKWLSGKPRELSRLSRNRKIEYFLLKFVLNYSLFAWLVGLIGILMFPLPMFHQMTKVDENALVPGAVNKYFDHNNVRVAYGFREKLKQLYSTSYNSSDPVVQFIYSNLLETGLDADIQPFSYNNLFGQNAYGIMRAPRSDGTESILVSVPLYCNKNGQPNINGISMALAFAKFTTQFSHWSKDLIFVFPDKSPFGTQAFLKGYHGEEDGVLRYSRLKYHGGEVQEALNLEFDGSADYTHLGLIIPGLNGLQANADVPIVVALLAQYAGVPMSLFDSLPDRDDSFAENAKELIKYCKYQSIGFPFYDHALYNRYRIEAITIVGHRSKRRQNQVGIYEIAHLLEASLRSFGNLLERLHHQFWFYLKPSLRGFILLSFYIIPIILLPATLVFQGLKYWYLLEEGELIKPQEPKPLETTAENEKTLSEAQDVLTDKKQKYIFYVNPAPAKWKRKQLGEKGIFFIAIVLLLAFHFIGFTVFMLPLTGSLYVFSALVTSLISVYIIIPNILIPKILTEKQKPFLSMLLKSMLCTELGLGLLSISTLNPSLSMLLSIPSVPVLVLMTKYEEGTEIMNRVRRVVKNGFLVFCFPTNLLLFWMFLNFMLFEKSWANFDAVFLMLIEKIQLNWSVFGGWLFPFVTCLYWPVIMGACVLVNL